MTAGGEQEALDLGEIGQPLPPEFSRPERGPALLALKERWARMSSKQKLRAKRLQRETHKAVQFNRVRGHAMPVITNLYSDHERLREIIRCGSRTFCERLEEEIQAAAAMQPWMQEESPELEDRVQGRLSDLPLLTHHERDGGRYITSGSQAGSNERALAVTNALVQSVRKPV